VPLTCEISSFSQKFNNNHPQVTERSYVRLGLRQPVAWGQCFDMRSHSVIAAAGIFAGTALDAGVAGSAGVRA
jgi:hypothetical protein